MIKRIWQTPNPLPRLHRLESIRKTLAGCRKISDSGTLVQQKNRSRDLKPRLMSYAITQQIGL